MRITSVNNQLIKDVVKLHQKKYRKQTGLFVVEGYHLYEEARQAGAIKQVFTTDETIVGEDVVYVTQSVLEKLAQVKQPQGVLTVCHQPTGQEVTEKILLLDHIQDPGNLGTLLRSALAFGFRTIVLDETVDVFNDKVLRSTQGAIFHLNLHLQSIASFMEEHTIHTYFGTAMTGTFLDDINPPMNFGIVLGNEGSGVAPELLEKTLFNITIPMEQTESLNVGVAGSIIMYHLRNE